MAQRRGGNPLGCACGIRGPRATMKKTPPLHVGRGPVPRHRSRARPCSSGSPDSELFVIRRSQTTEGETHIGPIEIAGDRPPRYGQIETRCLSYGNIACIETGRAHHRIYETPSLYIQRCVDLPRCKSTDVLLLCGGDKSSQRRDIRRAKTYWQEYKEIHR